MSHRNLTAVLIGCGRIGAHTAQHLYESLPAVWFPYSHLDAAAEVDGLTVTAVCDQDEETARSTAQSYGIDASFTDAETAIATTNPDIVMVATRMDGRSDILESAMRLGARGLHFEKPLAGTVGDCRRTMELAAAAGVHLTYGAVRRYMDVPRAARARVASGAVGDLRHVAIESAGGELLWAHPHNFDLITYFAGLRPVASVQARLRFDRAAWADGILDADPLVESCAIHFEDGLSASISVTGSSLLRISCDCSELVIGGNTSWMQETPRGAGGREFQQPTRREVEVTMSGRRRALEELVAAVRGQPAQCHAPDDILRSNQLGLACAWSAVNDGRAVGLNDVPPTFAVTGRKGDLYA